MPWNRTTRKDYKRDGRRYESDVTDKEWATLEPMIPKQGRLGRPRQTDLREVFNAIEYVLATGMPVAGAAARLSAPFYGHEVLLQVARQRCFRPHDGCAS